MANETDDLRWTFDRAASTYHRARPDYPDELYDDVLGNTGVTADSRLLELGCGSGKATLPLARRGFHITAVEMGDRLAAVAAANLADHPRVTVIAAPFEEWEAEAGSFDLAYVATAWHWLDPETKYQRVAHALRPGGWLAVWDALHAFPVNYDPFFDEIQGVYAEIGEARPGDWPPIPPEQHPDLSAAFEASGCFEPVAVRRYVWSVRYAADDYIALLDTFSGHIAMDHDKRAYLYSQIRRLLADRADPTLTRHWVSALTIGRSLT